MEELTIEQFEDATWWRKHKMKVYVAAGAIGGAVAGAAIMYLVKDKVSITITNSTIKNSPLLAGSNHNTITTTLERRGHPGFLIKDTRTGEVFASKRRTAEVLGVPRMKVDSLIAEGILEMIGEAQ